MKPEIAHAWNILRQAIANVNATLAEHQTIQNAAALVEKELAPPPPAPPAGERVAGK